MTNNNPFTTVFDMQRTAVKQTQKATLDTLEAQKQAYDTVADSFESYQSFNQQNAEFTKNAWFAYFDALESTVPEGSVDFDELRDFVEESVDTTTQSQDEILETLQETLDESGEAFESYYDNYADVVESSFDNFLAAHEQFEDNVEAATRATEEIDVTSA